MPFPTQPQKYYVSPADIYPLTEYKNRQAKPNVRAGKASIIILTPYKEKLEEEK